MACNGCGSSTGLTKEQVENLINKLISDGELQAGLKSCEGDKLGKDSKVLLCATLAAQVNALLKDGLIDVVKDVSIVDGKLVVTDGTGDKTTLETPWVYDLTFDSTKNTLSWKVSGEDTTVTLPYAKATVTEDSVTVTDANGNSANVPTNKGSVKATKGDSVVIFTLADGSTVEIPLSALSGDDFDYTIVKSANQTDKYGVKLGNNSGLEVGTDGISVKTGSGLTVNNGSVTVATGDGLTIDSSGNLAIDSDDVTATVGTGLAGSGLTYANGTMSVATTRMVDASGTVVLGYLVNPEG